MSSLPVKPPSCKYCDKTLVDTEETREDGDKVFIHTATQRIANDHGKYYCIECVEKQNQEWKGGEGYTPKVRPHTYHEEGEEVSKTYPNLLADTFSI